MVFRSRYERFVKWAVAVGCVTLLTGAVPNGAQEPGTHMVQTGLASVRVDLQAGTFLDPLPFDQTFLIEGLVPVTTDAVEVRITELSEAPVSLSEEELQPSRPPVRWDRLGELAGGREKTSRLEAEPQNWNRLERIRALARTPDDEALSGSGWSQQGGGEAGWRPFRVLVQPLEAERYCHFHFRVERRLTEAETDAFVAAARRWAEAMVADAPRGSTGRLDSQRLRAALTEALSKAVDTNRFEVPGSAFDSDAARSGLRADLVRLAEDHAEDIDSEEAGESLVAALQELARQQRLVLETGFGAATADNDYVSADLGLLYAGRIGEPAAYVGANFYLRPVNKGVPLRQKGGPLRRFAFTVGLTLNSIEDNADVRSDLYFNHALVLGAGYRVSQYWRVGVGGLVFRERDPDSYPLTRKKRTAVTPYVAMSFDADIGQQLTGIGGLFDFLKDDE